MVVLIISACESIGFADYNGFATCRADLLGTSWLQHGVDMA
jgi:hypothetical protein